MKHDESHVLRMLFDVVDVGQNCQNQVFPQQSLLNYNLDALSIALFRTVKKMEIE